MAKSFLVYLSDIYTAITMLTSKTWSSSIYTRCPPDECPTVSFEVGRWIFVACIIFSFLLVCYVSRCQATHQQLRSSHPIFSWRTKHRKPRKSSQVEISPTLSQTLWPTPTTVYVGHCSTLKISRAALLTFDRSQGLTTTSASSPKLRTRPRRRTTSHSLSSSPSKVCFLRLYPLLWWITK